MPPVRFVASDIPMHVSKRRKLGVDGANFLGLSDEHAKLAQLLVRCKHGHVFEAWKMLTRGGSSLPSERVTAFFSQISELHKNYPGGLEEYSKNIRKHLADSRAGSNAFSGWSPEHAIGDTLPFESEAFVEAETLGVRAMKDAVFVLVAGGLGERLGFSSIKVCCT